MKNFPIKLILKVALSFSLITYTVQASSLVNSNQRTYFSNHEIKKQTNEINSKEICDFFPMCIPLSFANNEISNITVKATKIVDTINRNAAK